jgi:hypothetical protein
VPQAPPLSIAHWFVFHTPCQTSIYLAWDFYNSTQELIKGFTRIPMISFIYFYNLFVQNTLNARLKYWCAFAKVNEKSCDESE